MNITPLNSLIYGKELPLENTTSAGIILVNPNKQVGHKKVLVKSVAKDITSVKEGDIVYIPTNSGKPFSMNNEEFVFFTEMEIDGKE